MTHTRPTTGLVLAGGGVAGITWELGVLRGIRDVDSDLYANLAAADVVVGTSAGSAVAAQVTSHTTIEEPYSAQLSEASSEIDVDLDLDDLMARFAAATTGAVDARDMRRRIGALALATRTVDEQARRAAIAARLPARAWPNRTLLLPAVEAASGEMTIFTRDSGVELVDAVAASCAVPGVWPPVTIGGHRYIDGGTRSATNADLAAGCDRVLVITPSPAGTPQPWGSLDDEIEALAPADVHVVYADAASMSAIGVNSLSPATRTPSARAGRTAGRSSTIGLPRSWGSAPGSGPIHSRRATAPPSTDRRGSPNRTSAVTRFRTILALAVTTALWASAFPAIRVGLEGYGVAGLTFLRLAVASIALALAAPVTGVRRSQARDLPLILLCAATGMAGYQLLLNWGEVHVPAGTASLLIATAPVFSVLLAAAYLGERLTAHVTVGSVVAVGGAAAIAVAGGDTRFTTSAWIVLGAAVVQGVYHFASKPLLARYSALEVAAYATWAGTVMVLPLAPATVHALATAPLGATTAGIFLGLLPSAVGFVVWGYAVARSTVTTATSVLYLVPVIALLVSFVWLDEIPTLSALIGGGVAIAGVVVIRLPSRRRPTHADESPPQPGAEPTTEVGTPR